MTTRTQYMTMFTDCGKRTAELVVASERGLGTGFESAVKKLLEENSKSTTPEVVVAFDMAIEAMEEAAREVLVKEFGEYGHNGKAITLSSTLPSFKVYKSTYKKLLKKMGAEAATLPKLTINAVKLKLAELEKPTTKGDDADNKGPNSTDTAGESGDTATTSGDSTTKSKTKLDPEVQKHLDAYAEALAQLPTKRALGFVKKSEELAWGALKEARGNVAKFAKAS